MRYLFALVVTLMVAGCAGHAALTEPPVAPLSRASQEVSLKPLPIPAYVLSINTISSPYTYGLIFLDKSYNRIVTIKNAAESGDVQMDTRGEIFIENNNDNSLVRYSPPYTEYRYIKTANGGAQFGFAVDPKTGDLAVSDMPWNDGEPPAALGFYRAGRIWPCKVLWRIPWALTWGAYDGADVPFMMSNSGKLQSTILSFQGGCDINKRDVNTFSPQVTGPIFFNAKDQLVVPTYTAFNVPGPIVTYPHPDMKTGQIGKALFKTVLAPIDGKTPYFESFNSDGTNIMATTVKGGLAIYKYPAGGNPIKVVNFDNDYIDGDAAYPPLIP